MEELQLVCRDGIYSAPIDITVEEWKEMLLNSNIFDELSRKMIVDWYNQPFHQATSKEVMNINKITGGTPYNGIVIGLGKRIIKHLNRFEVLNTTGTGKSYFIIPFEGWYKDYVSSNDFVWKVRDQLAQALEEINWVDSTKHLDTDCEIDSYEMCKTAEGQKISYFTTRYERSIKNRAAAIKIHGAVCSICGFDYGKVYGNYGKDYIEVHHVKPLSELNEKVEINPETDLICVCANCHRMIHRRKHDTLSPEQLRTIVFGNKC